jgi:hypothetical protein
MVSNITLTAPFFEERGELLNEVLILALHGWHVSAFLGQTLL